MEEKELWLREKILTSLRSGLCNRGRVKFRFLVERRQRKRRGRRVQMKCSAVMWCRWQREEKLRG